MGTGIRLGSGKDTMMIRGRGKHRFDKFSPNDLTLLRRRNHDTGMHQSRCGFRSMPAGADAQEPPKWVSTWALTTGLILMTAAWSKTRAGLNRRYPIWLTCSVTARVKSAGRPAIASSRNKSVACISASATAAKTLFTSKHRLWFSAAR